MNRDKIAIIGAGSIGMSVTQSLSERGIVIVDPKAESFAHTIGQLHENPFEQEPIPYTNPYAGFEAYTPDLSGKKKRKCSNKKYVKRKKARNGR